MHPLQQALRQIENKEKATFLQRFFKSGKGEYAEGDIFLGLTVPQTREIAEKFSSLPLKELTLILHSSIHEERLSALLILVHQFEKNPERRKELFDFYLANTQAVNNWDLVDLSAPNIVGRFIFNEGKKNPQLIARLIALAESNNLWERRIAIVSTYYFIKNNRFDETLHIAELLLKDKHDLIHKAVGWMLREVGKKDVNVLKSFLAKHYKTMPRTMLRYSIEKFPEKERKAYLEGRI